MMSLEVQVNEVDAHLLIKAVGRYSLAHVSELFVRAKEEIEKRDDHEAILDITEVAGTIPVMDMHVLGEHCARVWKLQFRIAVVSPEGGLNKFFENVARNRGVQIAVVPNQGAAIAWLT
jgi:hypothetical protein